MYLWIYFLGKSNSNNFKNIWLLAEPANVVLPIKIFYASVRWNSKQLVNIFYHNTQWLSQELFWLKNALHFLIFKWHLFLFLHNMIFIYFYWRYGHNISIQKIFYNYNKTWIEFNFRKHHSKRINNRRPVFFLYDCLFNNITYSWTV